MHSTYSKFDKTFLSYFLSLPNLIAFFILCVCVCVCVCMCMCVCVCVLRKSFTRSFYSTDSFIKRYCVTFSQKLHCHLQIELVFDLWCFLMWLPNISTLNIHFVSTFIIFCFWQVWNFKSLFTVDLCLKFILLNNELALIQQYINIYVFILDRW